MGDIVHFLGALLCALAMPLACASADDVGVKIPKIETPEVWQNQVCRQYPGAACDAAQALHWFRTKDIYFETGFTTMRGAAMLGSVALVARWIAGESETIQFLLSFSRAGMVAGALMVASGAAVAVMATVASAWMISPAGDYYDDKPDIAAQCSGVDLNQFKTAEGLHRLFTATPEEKQRLALCIPEDPSLLNFLKNSAANGAHLRHRVLPPT